jgi:transposase
MNNIIGVDLALKAIQVCVYTNNKVQSNSEMTPKQFSVYLSTLTPSNVIFEACAGSNYWSQLASSFGHKAKLISPRLVNVVRQNQKTDRNDALAIVQASMLPDINFVSAKSNEQQQAQAMLKLREQCIKQRTALKNQLMALLREFNIVPGRSLTGLIATIEDLLEDGENEFSAPFRSMLKTSLDLYLMLCEAIQRYDDVLNEWIKRSPECKKLMKIEGIGKLNAIHLYIGLSTDELGHFKAGKDAAACIGLTPIQHSSGGKVKLGTIGRRKNTSLRSLLITGAMSVVQQVVKREPKTTKEVWLKNLIERRGKKCAAVALANKNVRTAFALLKTQSEYRTVPV